MARLPSASTELASATFRRRSIAAGVAHQQLSVQTTGLVGEYVSPANVSPRARRAAVLVIGGSEGGVASPPLADGLATRGYPTLSLAYFAAPGLPSSLLRIPLEYFARALRWLRSRPGVDAERVYVVGMTRGSEAAELLSTVYPKLVHGLVASVPSNVSLWGLRRGVSTCDGPAWTQRGTSLPYTTQVNQPHPTDVPDAAIPIERVRGPARAVDQLTAKLGGSGLVVGPRVTAPRRNPAIGTTPTPARCRHRP